MAFGTATEGDPKWWPGWIRHAVLANLCLFVFVGNCYASGITTGYAALAAEFRVGFGPLTDLTSWSVFALGVGNLFWMPLAICIGKRIVILISMLLFMGGLIWSFKATTLDSLLAARIFASFAAGSVESIGPSMIADIYRERYFATSMALFSLFLSGGSQVGPVIAGYVVGDKGWRWFFIICTILNGFNILTCMFFLPETTYRRPYTYSGETAADIEKDATQQIENKVVQDHAERVSTDTLPNKPYAGSYWEDLYSFGGRGQEQSGLKAFPKQLTLPFRFLLVPAALYATVSYGVLLGGIVLASAQIPQFFVPPPYLYDSKAIGLFTLSSFLGVIVAYPFAGPLTDLLSRFLTKGNGGIHKPEHRVPALIMPFLLCPWGLILFAYTVAEHKSQYAAAAGYAFQAAGLCLIPSVVLSYVIDAYPTESGEALVLINAGKNVVAFGVVKANVDWLASQGIKKMYSEMAGIQWAVLALAVPRYYLGPYLRAKTLRFV